MQTSIEWLFEEYKLVGMLTTAMVDKAQEMHKQEIIIAHGEDRSYLQDDGSWKRIDGKQYYNETFKKD